MALDSTLFTFGLVFQVFLLDLILSADNAVVIALACRSLPSQQVKLAMTIGTGAAIGLRVLLTTLVSWLLQVPLLKLVGAALLIVIAIRLLVEEEQDEQPAGDNAPASLWGAVLTVLIADLVMSLDNVVALAAVTQGSVLYLVLGLLLSVPLLMFGSKLMTSLLRSYPILIPAGGALLGYIAGSIAVSDPAIADWVNTQSPALQELVPLLCAIFVVMESRIIERRRDQLPHPAILKVALKPEVVTAGAQPAEPQFDATLFVTVATGSDEYLTERQAINLPRQEQRAEQAELDQDESRSEVRHNHDGIENPTQAAGAVFHPPIAETSPQEIPSLEKRPVFGKLKNRVGNLILQIAIGASIPILGLTLLPKILSGGMLILGVGAVLLLGMAALVLF